MLKTKIIKIIDNTFILDIGNKKEENILNNYITITSNLGLEIGDEIYLSKIYLDKTSNKYCTFYSFGPLDSKYGKDLKCCSNVYDEVIKIKKKDKTYYLKRLYG